MVDRMKKISVIVPVYNVEKYLDRCVESIVNQTYKNLEIILVDDGSSDNCPQLCDEWTQRDERIKAVHKQNGGLADARNAGLEIAAGDYVGFIDADDYIDLDMFECLIGCAVEKDADISGCFYRKIGSNYVDELGSDYTVKVFDSDEYLCEYYRKNVLYFSCCNKIYRRELVGDTRFSPEAGLCEDGCFNYEVSKKAKTVVMLNKPMYNYILRDTSLTNNKKSLSGWLGSITSNYEILLKEKDNKILCTPIAVSFIDGLLNAVAQYIKMGCTNNKEYKEIIKILRDNLKMLTAFPIGKKRKIRLYCAGYLTHLYQIVMKAYFIRKQR